MPVRDAARMPITTHLEELRKRVLNSVIALSVAFMLMFNFSEVVLEWLKIPLTHAIHFQYTMPFLYTTLVENKVNLVFTAPAEALWMHMKIAFVAGIFVSMPFMLAQAWMFVSPGLLPKERRYALPFIVSATGMFVAGGLFCQYLVLPLAMQFLLGYKTEGLTPMISINSYIDFCSKFILAFGAVFQLPLVIMVLARLGIVSVAFLTKNRKYAVLLAFVLAAVLTPTPDAFNMILMAMPILVLYEVGIILARFTSGPKPALPEDEAGDEAGDEA